MKILEVQEKTIKKTIELSYETWKTLTGIKVNNNFRSFDETINDLLEKRKIKGHNENFEEVNA